MNNQNGYCTYQRHHQNVPLYKEDEVIKIETSQGCDKGTIVRGRAAKRGAARQQCYQKEIYSTISGRRSLVNYEIFVKFFINNG